ncbi:MAG: cyanophycinase [Gemmatimonadetes bacterium]|nr:cyanophycinase [Gemmatimonadota bacterium]
MNRNRLRLNRSLVATAAFAAAAFAAFGVAALDPAHANAQAAAGRLVIIGGGLNANNAEVYQAILAGRQGTGPLCVFPTAGATPDSAMAGPVANFDRHGGAGTARGILVSVQKPETAQDPRVVEQIRGCSGFFFIGGVQSRVSEAFRPRGKDSPAYTALMQRWREGAVVSGSSAGAAIMSDPMIASGTSAGAFKTGLRRLAPGVPAPDDDSGAGMTLMQGLGLFPRALADQHFLARGRHGRLLVALLDMQEYDLGFGIDENTALVVDGSRAWAAGASAVIVFDEKPAARSGSGATGIAMHMLASGDAFDVASRTATIAPKPGLAALPADSAAMTPPANPFTAWEWLRALDRFARTPATQQAFTADGGSFVMRKASGFRAAGASDAGVRGASRGLSMTGVTIDVKRS